MEKTTKIKMGIVFSLVVGYILDFILKIHSISLGIIILDFIFINWYQKKYSTKIYSKRNQKIFNLILISFVLILLFIIIYIFVLLNK